MYYSEFIKKRQRELELLESEEKLLCGVCQEFAINSLKTTIIAATALDIMARFGSTSAQITLDAMIKVYE